jgi:hypothetical protein
MIREQAAGGMRNLRIIVMAAAVAWIQVAAAQTELSPSLFARIAAPLQAAPTNYPSNAIAKALMEHPNSVPHGVLVGFCINTEQPSDEQIQKAQMNFQLLKDDLQASFIPLSEFSSAGGPSCRFGEPQHRQWGDGVEVLTVLVDYEVEPQTTKKYLQRLECDVLGVCQTWWRRRPQSFGPEQVMKAWAIPPGVHVY